MSSGLFPNRQWMPLLAKAYLKRMGLLNLSTGEDLSLCQHERSDEILISAYQQGPLLSWPFIHLCSLKCFSFLVCFKNILQHLKLILFEKFKPHIFQSYIKKFLISFQSPHLVFVLPGRHFLLVLLLCQDCLPFPLFPNALVNMDKQQTDIGLIL